MWVGKATLRAMMQRINMAASSCLSIVLIGTWITSAWWGGGGHLASGSLFSYVYAGHWRIGWTEPWTHGAENGWHGINRHDLPFSWWFDWNSWTFSDGRTRTSIDIPIWLVAVPAVGLCVLLAQPRRRLRERRGLCLKCGYNLRGAEHEVCPECGAALRSVSEPTRTSLGQLPSKSQYDG